MIFRSHYCLLLLLSNWNNQKWNILHTKKLIMHCQAQWTRNTIISEEPCGTRKEYYWWENLPKCKYKFKFSISNVQAPNSKIKKGKKQHSTISDVLFTQGYRFWQPEKGWMSQALRKEKTKPKTEALT